MSVEYPDLPGITIWPWPAAADLAVSIEDGPAGGGDPAAVDDRVEREWERLRAANPRLFDGPILSVVRLDPRRGIACRRDSYKRLVVQPAVATGVEQLSVTGILISADEQGRPGVLLGRRGRTTRMYGGLWELAPSGGVDAPDPGRDSLDEADLLEQLAREMHEEIGEAAAIERAQVQAVLRDAAAPSYDVVFVCNAAVPVGVRATAEERWEYEEVRRVALADLPAFGSEHADAIIPPTRALLRFFGWAGAGGGAQAGPADVR